MKEIHSTHLQAAVIEHCSDDIKLIQCDRVMCVRMLLTVAVRGLSFEGHKQKPS